MKLLVAAILLAAVVAQPTQQGGGDQQPPSGGGDQQPPVGQGSGGGGQGSGGQPGGSSGLTACEGKTSGGSCSFTDPNGDDISGSCTQVDNGDVVCQPSGGGGTGGDTGGGPGGNGNDPSMEACSGASDGSSCSFTDPAGNGEISGQCESVESGDLVCQGTPSGSGGDGPGGNQQGGGNQQQPPTDGQIGRLLQLDSGLTACNGLAVGESCSFTDPSGSALTGTCSTSLSDNGDTVCQPSMSGDTGGGPGGDSNDPSMLACANAGEGDSCSFSDPAGNGGISGSCVTVDNGDFVCQGTPSGGDSPQAGGDGPAPQPQNRRTLRGSA